MLSSLSCARRFFFLKPAKTQNHIYKDKLQTCSVNVCVCIRAVFWWAMEVSPAAVCGCVPLWCWQGEGGYGIGAATAVFQTAAGAVSPLCSLSPPSSFSLSPNKLPVFLLPQASPGSLTISDSPPTCITNLHMWIATLYIVGLQIIVSDLGTSF